MQIRFLYTYYTSHTQVIHRKSYTSSTKNNPEPLLYVSKANAHRLTDG